MDPMKAVCILPGRCQVNSTIRTTNSAGMPRFAQRQEASSVCIGCQHSMQRLYAVIIHAEHSRGFWVGSGDSKGRGRAPQSEVCWPSPKMKFLVSAFGQMG